MLGIVVNIKPTTPSDTLTGPTPEEVEMQIAYVDNQQFDGYAQIVNHAQIRKVAFDKEVLSHPPQEVVFRAGDLIQVYHSDLNFTFKTKRKLLPKFSAPRLVINRNQNSYQLEMLEVFLSQANSARDTCVMTSNNYGIVNSQSQRIVHSEVQ